MKNKNILVGLGFGLLANINNKTKNRSSDIISNDSEYVERVVKLFNTSEEFDFQLRIKALKKWKGGEIIKLFGDERPEQILTEAVTNFDFEVIEKKMEISLPGF